MSWGCRHRICLCLPSCHPRFKSQAHHPRFYRCRQFVVYLSCEKNENKLKEPGFGPFLIKKNLQMPMNQTFTFVLHEDISILLQALNIKRCRWFARLFPHSTISLVVFKIRLKWSPFKPTHLFVEWGSYLASQRATTLYLKSSMLQAQSTL